MAALTGPDGLLSGLVAQLLETALSVELDDHLGYGARERCPEGQATARNGTSSRTVRTDVGPVTINNPSDRDGSFEPVVVPKHSHTMSGFNEQVLPLYAEGFTCGDIVDHVAEIYGSQVCWDLVPKVTDAVVGDMIGWQNRPLDKAQFPVVVANLERRFVWQYMRGMRALLR